jgi:deoxycytidylate deaminase
MENYIQEATRIANRSTMLQKHGCVIVHNRRIVATGYNYILDKKIQSIHAEIDAINKVKKYGDRFMSECIIIIVRLSNQDDSLQLSKPCCNCANYIKKNKIPKTYFSSTDTKNIIYRSVYAY